jgi:hypothetical protein
MQRDARRTSSCIFVLMLRVVQRLPRQHKRALYSIRPH